MLEPGAPGAQNDLTIITTHHPAITHMDALGHVFFDQYFYNGRRRDAARDRDGLTECDISALAPGIVTRGILLDVAGAEGLEYLPAPRGIGQQDLIRAERHGDVRVGRGDAIFVRVGLAKRLDGEGGADAREVGLTVDAVPWIHDREVAVFSGDCIEQLPSPYPRLRMPLHEIGLPAMGLVIVDNADVEHLAARCREQRRYTFLVALSPLRYEGATGSPVNPLVVF
jgi:kynurenine formamidase